jgi:hypothetical protein
MQKNYLGSAAKQSVNTDGWIIPAKLGVFEASGYSRFVGESRPDSRRHL